MAFSGPATLISLAARAAGTVTGDNTLARASNLDGAANLSIGVLVTAVSGTPSLAITIRWSFDGTNWHDVDTTADTMTAITGIGQKVKTFPRKAPFYQVTAVVSGTTPNMTYTVFGWTFG